MTCRTLLEFEVTKAKLEEALIHRNSLARMPQIAEGSTLAICMLAELTKRADRRIAELRTELGTEAA